MNQRWRIAWMFGVVLLACGWTRADDKGNVAALLDKGIKALGGEDQLAKFKAATWKAKGTLHQGTREIEYKGDWAMQAPHQFKSVVTGTVNDMEFKRVRVLDGDKGWSKQNDSDTDEMTKEAVEQTQRDMNAQWLTLLLPLRDKAFTLAPAGDAGIEVTAKDGRKFRVYFDKDSGLLVKMEAQVKDANTGQDVNQEIVYSNYKEFGGVKRPSKLTVKRDGHLLIEQEMTEFKPLEKLDEKVFAKP